MELRLSADTGAMAQAAPGPAGAVMIAYTGRQEVPGGVVERMEELNEAQYRKQP